MAVILVGLAYLNYKLDVGRLLGHAPSAFFRQIWLPLLFLLFYFLAWLGWWLWRLLRSPEDASEFPDIDAAWEEAKVALDRASIELTEVPLFLILGRPASGMAGIFEAARLGLTVDAVPRRPDAPVQVHANADGIYVSCTGASLLGRQAAILADELDEELTVREPASAAGRSLSPVGRPQLLEPADASGDSSTGVAVAEVPPVEPGTRPRRRRPALLKDAAEVERLTARLKHLCRLIARDRRPHCPLNGILLVVPFAATAADEDANQTGAICRADLAAAREVLQVHCPHAGRHLHFGRAVFDGHVAGTQLDHEIARLARWILDEEVKRLPAGHGAKAQLLRRHRGALGICGKQDRRLLGRGQK